VSRRRARQKRRRQQAKASTSRRVSARNWKSIGLAAGGAALVAALAVGLFVVKGTGSAQPIAQKAPSSSGGGLSLAGRNPITGKEVSLASFRGKPVVLNIWASWCTGCRAEARDLERFAKDHPEAQIVGLDTQDNSSAAKAFYSEFGWAHPSIEDTNGAIADKLGLQGLPTTLFLDARGRIVSRIVGASSYAGFTQGLQAAENT
jgi:thiol-disulfide isomerase/thioredoxin